MSPQIKQEALAWFVRQRCDEAVLDDVAFQQWLEKPGRQEAYAWAQNHFAAAAVLKHTQPALLERGVDNSEKSAYLRAWSFGMMAIAATIVVLLLIHDPQALLRVLPRDKNQSADLVTRLETRKGEIRTFVLHSDLTIVLDTDSQMFAFPSRDGPDLSLLSGRTRITASGARTVTIHAGHNTIRMHGGVMDVVREGARFTVHLYSGEAEMDENTSSPQSGWRVIPVVRQAESPKVAVPSDHQLPFDEWPTGWVSYHSVPLKSLVDQANRYATAPIVLNGSNLEHLRVSGRFHLTDTRGVAKSLAAVFKLDCKESDGAILLQR